MTTATTKRAPRKAKSKAPAIPPAPSRYEGGVWRPNAPGWPAQPRTGREDR